MKLLGPFLQKKKQLALDGWGSDSKRVAGVFDPLEKCMVDNVSSSLRRNAVGTELANLKAPVLNQMYPAMWNSRRHIRRVLREMLLSEALVDEYASYFVGLSDEQLDEVAASFKFENCLQREELNDAIRPKH